MTSDDTITANRRCTAYRTRSVNSGQVAVSSRRRPRPHHQGTYPARAQAVRDQAYADPTTRCWRCGHTLAEAQAKHPTKRVRWTAGHTIDGDSTAPLAPEHSTCNYAAGGQLGAQRRHGTTSAPYRHW